MLPITIFSLSLSFSLFTSPSLWILFHISTILNNGLGLFWIMLDVLIYKHQLHRFKSFTVKCELQFSNIIKYNITYISHYFRFLCNSRICIIVQYCLFPFQRIKFLSRRSDKFNTFVCLFRTSILFLDS